MLFLFITKNTVKMNNLTQKIQTAIPSLIELREGCVITFKNEHYPLTLFAIQGDLMRFYDENNTTYAWSKREVSNFAKIIGHEPQLNHLLKYLELKGVSYSLSNGVLYRYLQDEGFKINLDSNLLKDQPKPLREWLDKIE